ncbi:hypothetical protein ACM9VS_04915 [Legionella pneumophila]|uniref:hypothetical protein n=1 Tax=Legionella pneumophila TaxID=446 RepID=UPI003A4C64E1
MISFTKPVSKWLFIALVNVAIVSGIFFGAIHSNDNTTYNDVISSRLNDIQSQLITLQKEIKKPVEKIDLSSINQDFNKLAGLIEQLKATDEGKLNQLVLESRSELTQKLDTIHEVVSTLDKKKHPIKHLPITTLPFKVLSIDSIQQVSVASVIYDYKTVPMERGDTLAGWSVLEIDFGKQRLVFENSNKDRVLVNLEQGEQHV